MNSDELLERVAVLFCHYRGPSRFNSCCPGPVYDCQTKARAAIAIIEPAIRADERKPKGLCQTYAAGVAIHAGAKP